MDIETYKKVGEIIRIVRMAQQVEELACLHVEKLLADCLEIGGVGIDEPYDFGPLPALKDDGIEKIEVARQQDKKVMMLFHDKAGKGQRIAVSSMGVLDNVMHLFNHLSNRILENLSPEIKQAMDDAQKQKEPPKS
ncbi:MAG TPA: hypothetical protein P5346_11475 [Spirochaetota bacterium]|nr:hypothetical protein [Spirochaetota bacterium]HSA15350.1 hypothetical protein [Spirochaetota bacterium]